jgi:hypothetical protein
VLVAGVVALALAVAGVTYAYLHRGTSGATGSGSTHSSSAGAAPVSSPEQSTPRAASPTGGATTGGGGGGRTTGPPAQSVRVTVTGEHTDYSGSCPPLDAQAPTFTATFTVGSVPVDVSYRWVTKTGQVSDPGWKTLSFSSGDPRTKQRKVVVTAYEEGGSVHNAIGVEVRSPDDVTSDTVPFSVTCETETPSGGASPSTS